MSISACSIIRWIACAVVVAAIGVASLPAAADDLNAVVVASIHDSPRDGYGDSFNASPFEGLLRQVASQEDRAILEYDVSAYAGMTIISAGVSGTVSVNNAYDNGLRTFDFLLYEGNGQADLSDFEIAATWVGSGSYHPPFDTSFQFDFDVAAVLQALIDGGATYVGLKCDPTSEPNFPNILSELTILSIEAQPGGGCPADINGDQIVDVLDLLALLAAWGNTSGPEDINGDGIVNVQDLLALLAAWGPCP